MGYSSSSKNKAAQVRFAPTGWQSVAVKPDVSRFFVVVYQVMDAFGNTVLDSYPVLNGVTLSSSLTTGSRTNGNVFSNSGVRAVKVSVDQGSNINDWSTSRSDYVSVQWNRDLSGHDDSMYCLGGGGAGTQYSHTDTPVMQCGRDWSGQRLQLQIERAAGWVVEQLSGSFGSSLNDNGLTWNWGTGIATANPANMSTLNSEGSACAGNTCVNNAVRYKSG